MGQVPFYRFKSTPLPTIALHLFDQSLDFRNKNGLFNFSKYRVIFSKDQSICCDTYHVRYLKTRFIHVACLI